MDINLLRIAIDIAKEHKITDYPYIRNIYNNLEKDAKKPQESGNSQGLNNNNFNSNNNSIPQLNNNMNTFKYKNNVNNSIQTRFHNINNTFMNYTTEELEKKLFERDVYKIKI